MPAWVLVILNVLRAIFGLSTIQKKDVVDAQSPDSLKPSDADVNRELGLRMEVGKNGVEQSTGRSGLLQNVQPKTGGNSEGKAPIRDEEGKST